LATWPYYGKTRLLPGSPGGGTRIDAFNEAQLRSVLACLQPQMGPYQESSSETQAFLAIAALRAFEPHDVIEGMSAT
jgi:hypothetical protein